jgi:hypothetical protein
MEPDTDVVHAILAASGFSAAKAAAIVAESYAPDVVGTEVRAAAAATLGLFRGAGVLDDDHVREAFAHERLL